MEPRCVQRRRDFLENCLFLFALRQLSERFAGVLSVSLDHWAPLDGILVNRQIPLNRDECRIAPQVKHMIDLAHERLYGGKAGGFYLKRGWLGGLSHRLLLYGARTTHYPSPFSAFLASADIEIARYPCLVVSVLSPREYP